MRIRTDLIKRIIAFVELRTAAAARKTATRLPFCLLLSAVCASSAVAANRVTFYRDGALFQQEAVAVKGVINVPLAAGLLENTLKIIPDSGATILGVEEYGTDSAGRSDRELEALAEQRRRLEDRLQALDTREAVFTSAAKAQSGKAPRKTKTNPDPMQAIRQGTDFAIAQLEAVYTARRKTTQEIRKIDANIAAVRKNTRPAEHSLRIAVTPPRGKVTIRYATSERGWQPRYNLRLTGEGAARLVLSAHLTGGVRGYQVRVSPLSLTEAATSESLPAQSDSAVLADYLLPLTDERRMEGIFNGFSGMITNNTKHYLPAGESGLYRNGTYLGKFRFEGLSSGRSRAVSLGM